MKAFPHTQENENRVAQGRRGAIAGIGALAIGLFAARQGAAPVSASTGNFLKIGDSSPGSLAPNNLAEAPTVLAYDGGAIGSNNVFTAGDLSSSTSNFPAAVAGYAYNTSGITVGIYGVSNRPSGKGVIGAASSSATNGIGVVGDGTTLNNGHTAGTIGVQGLGNIVGVVGISNDSSSIGVKGVSTAGTGIYGTSGGSYGVLGYSTGDSASMSGISTNANIPAFAGGNSVGGGLAAHFSGGVYVDCTAGGQFVVNPMSAKSGLLKHPDGSHRLMYSVEAPESWAEDFGTGTLAGGKADIKLDADFAALIHTEDYHVFLTEHSDHHLHVSARTATGFTVEADVVLAKLKGKQTSELSGTFSWRIVAKPKVDNHKAERLAKFAIPQTKFPDPATLPRPPVATEKP